MKGLLTGHLRLGKVVVYGRNAMHWGVTIHTKRFGYICFRLPFKCFGKWWPLYLYFSPNATPWAATFMMGKREDYRDWALSRVRLYRLGHNFDSEKLSDILSNINDSL